jgi:hypothetical protein
MFRGKGRLESRPFALASSRRRLGRFGEFRGLTAAEQRQQIEHDPSCNVRHVATVQRLLDSLFLGPKKTEQIKLEL